MFWNKKRNIPHGLILYTNIQDVIYSHSVLQQKGLNVRMVAPPLEVAIGCDLAIQYDLAEEDTVKAMQASGDILPGKITVFASALPEVANLARCVEVVPGYLMGISNNIKVTIDLTNHEIVNLSGGGCPDIPYVASCLVGRRLDQCPEPIEIGNTLCTYMVQLALDKLRQVVGGC